MGLNSAKRLQHAATIPVPRLSASVICNELPLTALHIQPILIAVTFPGSGVWWGLTWYAAALAGAVLVARVPAVPRPPDRPHRARLTLLVADLMPAPTGFAWLPAVLVAKLAVGSVREEPYRPATTGPATAGPTREDRSHKRREEPMFMITGATGTIGRPLVELLAGQGTPVRAVTRAARAAGLPAQAAVITGDPSRPDTVAAALDGVDALFLVSPALGDATAALLALARDHEVRRVVLLSALAVEDPARPRTAVAAHHQALEDTVTAAGMEWVILRPGMFAANTLTQWAAQIRAGDTVRGPYPDATDAPVHEHDVAAVAARALLDPELAGSRIRVTGPRSLTRQDMVGIIGEVIGRPLRYQEIPPETVTQAMTARGVPEPMAAAMLAMMSRSVGHPAVVSHEAACLLGRPARSFGEWVSDHADAFTG
jgi:uncharacterized protein YbjT (DUF2867 family)